MPIIFFGRIDESSPFPDGMRKAIADYKGGRKNMDNSQINDHSDPVTFLKAAIVMTNTDDEYSKGFRNALRFAIGVLTGEEPKYEE